MYCGYCGAKNPEEYRFCGMCGQKMTRAESAAPPARPRENAPDNVTVMPREPQRPVPLGEVLAEKEAAEKRRAEREAERYIGEPARTVAPPPPPPPRKDLAPAHLGGPSFLGLSDPEPAGERTPDYLLDDEDYRPRRSYGRFMLLLLILGVFGLLGYIQWQKSGGQIPPAIEQALGTDSEQNAASSQDEEAAAQDQEVPAADAPSTPADSATAPAGGPPPVNPEAATAAAQGEPAKEQTKNSTGVPSQTAEEDDGARADEDDEAQEPAPKETASAAPPAVVEKPNAGSNESAEGEIDSAAGDRELELGRAYLSGRYGERDAGEAAKWLWKAVSKGNHDASLALADLYLAGEGVEKNCEQARVLLTAAARKGNSDAASKLRTVECE